ncbi:hypothetical protein CDIK_0801 [Cucumispora dikerogammari]|nr:hypothetical protein CDIK_0801 [Cucumispora dikerogammari]
MSDKSTRKTRTTISRIIFEQVKRMWKRKTKKELMDITSLSRTAINVLISKIEKNEILSFEDFYFKARRKKKCKEALRTEIMSTLGNDNSTLRGCKDKILVSLSIQQLSREIKPASMTKKRIKKRSNVVLTRRNIFLKKTFCSRVLRKISKTILFFDKSRFNLHTSINYGYSMVNEDAFLYQPDSKGQNILLCGIISNNS